MTSFTIRDIENLTGIKAHTLRIWEQRYEFFRPKRKESQHRFYDNEDLKKLLRIAFLYHNGWKVSRIASLSESEMMDTIRNSEVGTGNNAVYTTRLLEAALDFDETRFQNMFQEISDKIGFEKCIVDVCYPYLNKIGLLWSTNNVIPAQEHFSSYIIQNRIIVETEKLQVHTGTPGILLICPQGEFHELPLLFINYLLRKNGWKTLFLGANIRKHEIALVTSLHEIDYIYLHLITNFTGMYVDDYLEDICRQFAGKTIVASGAGIRDAQRSFVNLKLLRSDRQIYDFIEKTTLSAEHNS